MQIYETYKNLEQKNLPKSVGCILKGEQNVHSLHTHKQTLLSYAKTSKANVFLPCCFGRLLSAPDIVISHIIRHTPVNSTHQQSNFTLTVNTYIQGYYEEISGEKDGYDWIYLQL